MASWLRDHNSVWRKQVTLQGREKREKTGSPQRAVREEPVAESDGLTGSRSRVPMEAEWA